MTEADALAELADLVAVDKYPKLPEEDLIRILNKTRRWTVWAAASVYEEGDRIVPTKRTGRQYRCIAGGTSGETEPIFGSSRYAITDGVDGLRWSDAGPASRAAYDLIAAAQAAWTKKAALVAADHDFKDKDATYTKSQVYDHCVQMANSFVPAFIV